MKHIHEQKFYHYRVGARFLKSLYRSCPEHGKRTLRRKIWKDCCREAKKIGVAADEVKRRWQQHLQDVLAAGRNQREMAS